MTQDSLQAVGGAEAVAIPPKLAETVVNQGLLHHLVVDFNARQRSGTHSTKTRAKVAGGGAKPWRQKGTGRARAGYSSPVWVGGGIAHGPKPRSYGGRINKKEKALGLLHAVKARLEADCLYVFKAPSLDVPKTSEAMKIIEEAGLKVGKSVSVVLDPSEELLYKSLRNVSKLRVCSADKANIVDLLSGQALMFSEAGWTKFNQRFEKSTGGQNV